MMSSLCYDCCDLPPPEAAPAGCDFCVNICKMDITIANVINTFCTTCGVFNTTYSSFYLGSLAYGFPHWRSCPSILGICNWEPSEQVTSEPCLNIGSAQAWVIKCSDGTYDLLVSFTLNYLGVPSYARFRKNFPDQASLCSGLTDEPIPLIEAVGAFLGCDISAATCTVSFTTDTNTCCSVGCVGNTPGIVQLAIQNFADDTCVSCNEEFNGTFQLLLHYKCTWRSADINACGDFFYYQLTIDGTDMILTLRGGLFGEVCRWVLNGYSTDCPSWTNLSIPVSTIGAPAGCTHDGVSAALATAL